MPSESKLQQTITFSRWKGTEESISSNSKYNKLEHKCRTHTSTRKSHKFKIALANEYEFVPVTVGSK